MQIQSVWGAAKVSVPWADAVASPRESSVIHKAGVPNTSS